MPARTRSSAASRFSVRISASTKKQQNTHSKVPSHPARQSGYPMACARPAHSWSQRWGPARRSLPARPAARCHVLPCPLRGRAGTHHLRTHSPGPVPASPKHAFYAAQTANAAPRPLSHAARTANTAESQPRVSAAPPLASHRNGKHRFFREQEGLHGSARRSVSAHVRLLPLTSSHNAGLRSGPLRCAAPPASNSELLAIFWHQN